MVQKPWRAMLFIKRDDELGVASALELVSRFESALLAQTIAVIDLAIDDCMD